MADRVTGDAVPFPHNVTGVAAMSRLSIPAVAFAVGLGAMSASHAQGTPQRQSPPRAPATQYFVDVATHASPSMPGGIPIPGMGGGQNSNEFGNTRAMSKGKFVDLALVTRNKPGGTQGIHAIPPGFKLGASLPLVPLTATPRGESDTPGERPRGRILIYWGCGEAIGTGQPRTIDLTAPGADFARAFSGRFVPERGARAAPGWAVWPNPQDRRLVPGDASLTGDHAVSGDGVPASLKFALGTTHDFMPSIELTARGDVAASIGLEWKPVTRALGFFAAAMSSKGNDMILWTSSEQAEAGFGLLDYLPPASVERWIRERVLLPASATSCRVPRGIFAGADGAMARLIAYGPELNIVHPPRPANPEWSARVRVKSTSMVLLGIEGGVRGGGGSSNPTNPLNILRGILR